MSHSAFAKLRESPRDWRTLRWLRKKPHPAYVIGTDGEEEETRVKIGAGRSDSAGWADATRALHSCDKLKAFDEAGNVLRVLEHEENDPVLLVEAEREEAKRGAPGAFAHGGAPIISIDVPRLVREIADSMKDVAKSSAEAQKDAYSEGFRSMGQVVQLCLNLLVRLEERLDTAPAPEAPSEGAQRDAMAQQLLARALGGNAPSSPAAAGGGLDALLRSVSPQQIQQFLELMNSGGARVEVVDNDAGDAGDAPNGSGNHGH